MTSSYCSLPAAHYISRGAQMDICTDCWTKLAATWMGLSTTGPRDLYLWYPNVQTSVPKRPDVL